jgi:hypothetical protein
MADAYEFRLLEQRPTDQRLCGKSEFLQCRG